MICVAQSCVTNIIGKFIAGNLYVSLAKYYYSGPNPPNPTKLLWFFGPLGMAQFVANGINEHEITPIPQVWHIFQVWPIPEKFDSSKIMNIWNE